MPTLSPVAGQFLRFCLTGGVGFVIDAGTLYVLLHAGGLDPYSGRVVSYLTAATVTWLLNRSFTFVVPAGAGLHREWLRYVSANAVGGGINYLIYAACIAAMPIFRAHPIWAVAVGSGVALLFNFSANKFLVFRPR